MVRILILGGFELSGHDAMQAAMDEVFRSLGADVTARSWREIMPGIEDHPVFHLHRLPEVGGLLAGILDDRDLSDRLADDISHRLTGLGEFDIVLSVHPWSTVVAARALERDGLARVFLADCTGEYCAIPIVTEPRVDLYCGGSYVAPVSPILARKCVPTGVPIRPGFAAAETVPGKLFVMAGRAGHSLDHAVDAVSQVLRVVLPSKIYIAGATGALPEALGPIHDIAVPTVLVPNVPDISSYMRGSEWVVTKSSGTAVGEALASGATVITYKSGVFWEDEEANFLAAAGAITPVEHLGSRPLSRTADHWQRDAERAALATARVILEKWNGSAAVTDEGLAEGQNLIALVPRPSEEQTAALPRTSLWFDRKLQDWLGHAR